MPVRVNIHGLRLHEAKSWMPAFAGMTNLAGVPPRDDSVIWSVRPSGVPPPLPPPWGDPTLDINRRNR